MSFSLEVLRRYALRRSLFAETTLPRAITRLGFVQADPIRAPARAQDLTLFQRVKHYRAGELERRYASLRVEEDFFVNYGFLARKFRDLMHPRSGFRRESKARLRLAEQVLELVRERGAVHPREVERELGSGTETNYWGGTSNTTTRLLDQLHYRGLLRVARRDAGIRVYALAEAVERRDGQAARDALVDVAVKKYAPLPAASLAWLVGRLRYAAPQWRGELAGALARAKERLATVRIDGIDWYFPGDERVGAARGDEFDDARVRLLGPFDPVVWDRRRFEAFWGWAYRLEAYTPVAKRKLGYYALPVLWRERVLGWANLSFAGGRLSSELGFVSGRAPRDPVFRRALEAELSRVERFLGDPRPR